MEINSNKTNPSKSYILLINYFNDETKSLFLIDYHFDHHLCWNFSIQCYNSNFNTWNELLLKEVNYAITRKFIDKFHLAMVEELLLHAFHLKSLLNYCLIIEEIFLASIFLKLGLISIWINFFIKINTFLLNWNWLKNNLSLNNSNSIDLDLL